MNGKNVRFSSVQERARHWLKVRLADADSASGSRRLK